jgi:carbonic anhydrase
MKGFRVFIAVVVISALAAFAYAGGAGGGEALEKLIEGNKRFSSDKPVKADIGDKRRKELTKGQHPFATVVACSDSRVGPELIFNQGLGDVFVVRTAGNVVDPIALGSIEYAVEHLHTPLLIVLGHQSCGAVKATLEATGEPEGNIGEIVKKIMPAVRKAKSAGLKDEAETLDSAVRENARNVLAEIMERSAIVREHVHEGKLKAVAAEYYLDSGMVKLIN